MGPPLDEPDSQNLVSEDVQPLWGRGKVLELWGRPGYNWRRNQWREAAWPMS